AILGSAVLVLFQIDRDHPSVGLVDRDTPAIWVAHKGRSGAVNGKIELRAAFGRADFLGVVIVLSPEHSDHLIADDGDLSSSPLCVRTTPSALHRRSAQRRWGDKPEKREQSRAPAERIEPMPLHRRPPR